MYIYFQIYNPTLLHKYKTTPLLPYHTVFHGIQRICIKQQTNSDVKRVTPQKEICGDWEWRTNYMNDFDVTTPETLHIIAHYNRSFEEIVTHNSKIQENSDFELINKLQKWSVSIEKSNFEFFVNYFGIGNYYSDSSKLNITI
jgi:hypothetical protein